MRNESDDVADMVAHDAAVGIPGWSRVDEPEENTLAWAEQILADVTPATRAQVNTAMEVPLFTVARTLRNRGPQVTWPQLLESMLTNLIETVHGPGVAVEVEALMSWWRDLPDEKRAATGVPLERTFQPPASAAERLVDELRTLLRDWSEHTDTALVTLTQDMLRHHGFWGDADHDAACERRSKFNEGVAKSDRAYDGWSVEPQKRALTARERDILTRMLRDVLSTYRDNQEVAGRVGLAGLPGGEARVMVEPGEIEQLQTMRFVLDPRHD